MDAKFLGSILKSVTGIEPEQAQAIIGRIAQIAVESDIRLKKMEADIALIKHHLGVNENGNEISHDEKPRSVA